MTRTDPCRVVNTTTVTGADPRPQAGVPAGDQFISPQAYDAGVASGAYNSSKFARLDGFYKNYRGITIAKSLELYTLNAKAYSVNAGFSPAKREQWESTLTQLNRATATGVDADEQVWTLIRSGELDLCTPLVNPINGPSPFGVARNSPPKSGRGAAPITNVNNPKEVFKRYHNGIDYHTNKNGLGINQPCYAIADGEVIMSGLLGSAGITVRLHHGFGITSRYLHLLETRVKRGDKVKKGQVIGLCGDSEGGKNEAGKAVAIHGKGFPHLHFEIRINVGTFEQPPTWKKSLNSDAMNFPIDPGPLLINASQPGQPSGPPTAVAALAADRASVLAAVKAPLAGAAPVPSRETVAGVMGYYDQITASLRAELIAGQTRKDIYAAASAAVADREAAVATRTKIPTGITPR